jgi:type I restriction-modification system DNA methylase subunit
MNKKLIIDTLLKKLTPEDVEKYLVWMFIKQNSLDLQKSNYLSKILDGYNNAKSIHIDNLQLTNLKQLENLLELIIPSEDRKINGAFFTPTYIVDFIVNELSPKDTDKCLDPSCGCGAFLIGLVDYYKNKYNKSIKDTITKNLYGSDILEYNIKRTKIILCIYGLLQNEIIEEADFNIYHQDSLKANWESKFDIIVGNPPLRKISRPI